MSHSRLLTALAEREQPDLWIQLAGSERLPVHRHMLSWSSSVVRDLPEGSDTWDLSGLLIGDAPVSEAVVLEWLAAVYPPVVLPTAPGGGPELADLLEFADAVGSSDPAVLACCARVDRLVVRAGGGPAVQLHMDGRLYEYCGSGLRETGPERSVQLAPNQPGERAAFSTAVAAQLERLLLLTYKLQLPELREKLRHFIFINSRTSAALLGGAEYLDMVFSERVLSAVPQSDIQSAWLQRMTSERHMLFGKDGLFKEAQRFELDRARLSFVAELNKRFMGAPKGMTVKVTWQLDDGRFRFEKQNSYTMGYFTSSIVLMERL